MRVQTNKLHDALKATNENLWCKIGEVKDLYIYPLYSGQATHLNEFKIENNGIFNGEIWNDMLIIYNGESKCIYDNTTAKLSLVSVKYVKYDKLELTIYNSTLNLDLKKIKENKQVKCVRLVNGKYIMSRTYSDCGDEVSIWLHQYLGIYGARIGYTDPSTYKGKLQDCYKWLCNENGDNNGNLPISLSCKLISQDSFDKVKESANDIKMSDFYPNIVIKINVPFKEDEISWFKIGNAVVRPLKPCLKFGNETKLDIPPEIRMNFLSLHCETIISGLVQAGDKICTISENCVNIE